jgi:hypothetical protein
MCMLELEKAGGRDEEGEGEDDALLRRRLLCLLFFSLSASYAIREPCVYESLILGFALPTTVGNLRFRPEITSR